MSTAPNLHTAIRDLLEATRDDVEVTPTDLWTHVNQALTAHPEPDETPLRDAMFEWAEDLEAEGGVGKFIAAELRGRVNVASKSAARG